MARRRAADAGEGGYGAAIGLAVVCVGRRAQSRHVPPHEKGHSQQQQNGCRAAADNHQNSSAILRKFASIILSI